ncbi:MAG: flagellar biosynthesis protein FlhB [Pseudomonadales bacterium]
MAEEQQGQERTEEPTPRRLQKAREEGQVARSRELTSMALVTVGAATLLLLFPSSAKRVGGLMSRCFELAANPQDNMFTVLETAMQAGLAAVLPFLVAVTVLGGASMVMTGGVVLSAKAFAFKGSRISPISGFKRMFSVKSVMELGKSIAKFLLIAGISTLALSGFVDGMLALSGLTLESAVAGSVQYVGLALLFIGMSLVVVAAIDVPFQIAQHRKQLKMTKQEVKDELKDSEGKPEVRSRIRQLQQEISQRQMLKNVPDADVIITNPEHYSVALKYDGDAMAAPVVLAKGADHMAFRIREIGRASDVPQIAVPPLARAVYYASEVGEEIPGPLYVAVAKVLAYVYQLDMYRRGQVRQVPVLGEVDIPTEFAVDR